LQRDVARQDEHIRQADTFDHNAMRREVTNLAQVIKENRRFVEDFNRTALAYLLNAGMHPGEVEKAFHVLHPEMLKLIVGEHFEVKSPEDLMDLLKSMSSHVKQRVYQDEMITVRLEALRGPDTRINLKDAAAGLDLDEQRLREQRLRESQERLKVADGLESAKSELKAKRQELALREATLNDYAMYQQKWAEREQLDARFASARTRASEASERVRILEGDIRQLEAQLRQWRDEKTEIQQSSSTLHQHLSEFRSATERFNLSLEEEEPDEPFQETHALRQVAEGNGEQIKKWLERDKVIERRRGELKRIEDKIVEESTHSRAQRIYFDDAEQVWIELTEKREALTEQENSVQKQWDDLFTLLAANFEQIIVGCRNVETAVRALNRNIKSYQVSNLKAVELSVERIRATYDSIETLASKDSIFKDPDKIEVAKRNLRNMIEGRHIIELDNLFEIRIRVQENDGKWNEAKSLDDIGSTGTGITAKAMIFIQLVRAIIGNNEIGLHFYLDETGQLDDENLKATTAMAVSRGMVPITAQPGVRMESLAHPTVTVYTLATTAMGRFLIDGYQTYHAQRAAIAPGKASHEQNRIEVLKELA